MLKNGLAIADWPKETTNHLGVLETSPHSIWKSTPASRPNLVPFPTRRNHSRARWLKISHQENQFGYWCTLQLLQRRKNRRRPYLQGRITVGSWFQRPKTVALL